VLSATRSAALIGRLCRSLSAFATVELHDNLRAKDDSQSGKGEQHPRSARARPGLLAWVLLKAAEELQRGVGLSREGFDSSIKLVEAGATPDFIFEGRVGIPTLESRNKGLEIGFPTPSEPVLDTLTQSDILHPSPSTLLGATSSVARSSTDAAALMHFLARRHAIMLTQAMDGADFAAVGHPKPPPAWTATAIHGAGLM
jgi:hypothetical protein